MRFSDLLRTPMRNIRRQKLRSTLTILAVVIGATSVTIMLSLVTSAKSFIYNQYKSSGQLEQVIVTREAGLDYQEAQYGGNGGDDNTGVKLTDALAQRVHDLPHVTGVAVTAQPYVFDHLLVGSTQLPIKGTRADDTNGVIVHAMLAGNDFARDDNAGVVLVSKAYANKLGYRGKYDALAGQQVKLVTQPSYSGPGATLTPPAQGSQPPGQNREQQQRPTELSATIKGVVDAEDETLYVTLPWARTLMTSRHYEMTGGGPGTQPTLTLRTENDLDRRGYSTLVVRADNESRVDEVATTIRTLGVGAATARSYVSQQLQMFDILSYVLGAIGAIALAVAALCVINTMVMAILKRTREIGILRACGATRAAVRRLFMLEASLLGFWGGVAGVGVGFGLTRVANVFVNDQLSKNSLRARDIIGVPLWLVFVVVGATTGIGLVAGLYPARRAARLDPVEALHYD